MNRKTFADFKMNRDKITKRSPSVAEIKTEIRKQFRERLRQSRDHEINKLRASFQKYSISEKIKNYSDIKNNLLETYDIPENVDIVAAFLEIEDELNNEINFSLVQHYENYINDETDMLVKSFESACVICDNFYFGYQKEKIVCPTCSRNYFYTENL